MVGVVYNRSVFFCCRI